MPRASLLDTSVIIDAINDRHSRSDLLEQMIAQGILLACCPINITDVHMGMRPEEATSTEVFLDSLEFYPITREIAKKAGTLYQLARKSGHTLALADLTIAAVAICNDLQLATDNLKHFPLPGLNLYPLP